MVGMSRVGLFGQISEINEHLYLSGVGVLKPDKLRSMKIACIVNATTDEPNGYIQGIDYVKVRLEDHPLSRLDAYFDMVADRIKENHARGQKTLVHCVAGVSRSASLCIVYLMKHKHMSLREAYIYVKSARSIIRPNCGFWKQMIDYERRITGTNTVRMVDVGKGNGSLDSLPDVYVDEIRHRTQQQREQQALQGINQRAASVGASSSRARSSMFAPETSNQQTLGTSNGQRSSPSNRFGTSSSNRYSSTAQYGQYSQKAQPSPRYNTYSKAPTSAITSYPSSRIGLMTPGVRSGTLVRPRQYGTGRKSHSATGNLFSNLYNSTAELMYPGF